MADPALLIAVGGELDRIRAQAERAIAQVWDALPGTPRALIGEWVDVAAPILDGVAQAAVAVTDAYLARALADQPLGITVPEATAALGGGIPTEQILERPFLRTWHHLNMGATYEIARQAGRTYATSIAAGAVSRSHFGAMHASLDSRPWVQGYRRVVSGAGACDFCITIAGNTYSRADIAPAHRSCDCIVEPIPGREYAASRPGTAARNVGQVIDRRGAPIPAARLDEARAQFSRSGGKPVARPRATVTT